MAKTFAGSSPISHDAEPDGPAPVAAEAPRGIQIRGAGTRRPEPAISPETAYPFVATWRGAGGPTSYIVTDTEILPHVREERLIPGVNGTIQHRDGSWDLTDLDYNLARSGAERLTVDACLEIDAERNLYRPAWAEVRRGLIVSDTSAHHGWLRALYDTRALADGPIPRPSADDLVLLRADLGNQIARLAASSAQHNVDARAVAERRLAVVDAAIAALGSAP